MDEPRLDVAVDALGRIARSSGEGPAPPVRASEQAPAARPAAPAAGPGLAPSLLLLVLVFAAMALSARSRACLELDAYARRRCGRVRSAAKRPARRRSAPLPHLGPPTLFAMALLLSGCASVRLGGGAAVPAPPGPEPARAAEPSALHPPPPPSALDRSSVTLTTAPRD